MFYSSKKVSPPKPTPLEELREAVSKIESLLKQTRKSYFSNSKKHKTKKDKQDVKTYKRKEYTEFIPMNETTVDELVELIRRTAELVVQGERYASVGTTNTSILNNGNKMNDTFYEQKKSPEEVESYLAVFEYFCEKNVLGLFVNIVTGSIFKETYDDEENGMTVNESNQNQIKRAKDDIDHMLLPPLTITTQIVQSISILVQNVCKATSLYLLLSNNWINELISFNIERYADALSSALRTNLNISHDSEEHQQHHAEMAELGTYFISFLKSLAMRMNAETLQFFLEYKSDVPQPITEDDPPSNGDNHNTSNGLDRNSSFHVEDLQKISELDVDFPLYARALKFCNSNQDSFVRVTAMNICLNTIRLAAVTTPPLLHYNSAVFDHLALIDNDVDEQIHEKQKTNYSSSQTETTPDKALSIESLPETKENTTSQTNDPSVTQIKYNSPDGTLVNVDLPTRERLAIAYHVCTPSRVQELVSPIFIQLTHLCGDLVESIRALEKNELGQGEKYEKERKKYESEIDRILADLQDEFLLLDDLLEVGLTSLNEQTIELMLATFVYPSLLQPLKIHLLRHPFRGRDESFYHTVKRYFESSSKLDNQNGRKENASYLFGMKKEDIQNLMDQFPFTSDSTNTVNDSYDLESLSSLESEPNEKFGTIIDSSPPKAALLTLISMLFSVKNRRAIYFVLTAVFHPLAPYPSGGHVVRQKQNILTSLQSNQIQIQVDPVSSDFNALRLHDMADTFIETQTDNDSGKEEEFINEDVCVFSLSPALAYILENGALIHYKKGDEELSNSGLRKNPYRQAMLTCLAGSDGMAPLRNLVVYAIDAAIIALEGNAVENIFFGRATTRGEIRNGNKRKENNSKDDECDLYTELISSLCSSIITASISKNDFWRLEYNLTAVHTLLGLVADDKRGKEKAAQLIQEKHKQSASYLSKLSSLVANRIFQSANVDISQGSFIDDEEENVVMDQLFRYSYDENKKSIVDYFFLDREENKFSAVLSKKSSMNDVLSNFYGHDLIEDRNKISYMRNAALSSYAHVQLDTFVAMISKDTIYNKNFADCTVIYDKKSKMLLCAIQPQINSAIFDEPIMSKKNQKSAENPAQGSKSPVPGSVVSLIGRSAFPCVCEVAQAYTSLFKDANSSVVANGVKWQSLYMVVVGKRMILVEPEKSSGGNGRIVTSCLLTCITVQKDKHAVTNTSPARRLIIYHTSISESPPGIFNMESIPEPNPKSFKRTNIYQRKLNQNGSKNEKDRNLSISRIDLWFEDENAANTTYQILSVRVKKARSKRGKMLRTSLQINASK